MIPWLIFVTMMNQQAACQNVQGEWIVGGDLARALPVFSDLPRDAALSYAPSPGATRVFQYSELKRIGAKYNIKPPMEARACFQWSMWRITAGAVRSAIRDALHSPDARVDVLDFSQAPVPDGKLEFPLSGLAVSSGLDSSTPVLWRGYVVYAGHRRFAVWSKVRVTATMTRVVAVEFLPPAKPVSENQVRLESYNDFPLPSGVARNLEEVIGRVPRRPIRANLPILRADLSEPFQVQRGEQVDVTVISGAAQVELEAVAENSGRQGDLITLTNPRSGKHFRARVEGKDRALLVASLRAGVQ